MIRVSEGDRQKAAISPFRLSKHLINVIALIVQRIVNTLDFCMSAPSNPPGKFVNTDWGREQGFANGFRVLIDSPYSCFEITTIAFHENSVLRPIVVFVCGLHGVF